MFYLVSVFVGYDASFGNVYCNNAKGSPAMKRKKKVFTVLFLLYCCIDGRIYLICYNKQAHVATHMFIMRTNFFSVAWITFSVKDKNKALSKTVVTKK